MSGTITLAEFEFVVNKSFITARYKPITIPSRFYDAFKEKKIMERVPIAISFRDESINGSIYVGWRAGGKYYQIKFGDYGGDSEITRLKMGARLKVRLHLSKEDWLVDLK